MSSSGGSVAGDSEVEVAVPKSVTSKSSKLALAYADVLAPDDCYVCKLGVTGKREYLRGFVVHVDCKNAHRSRCRTLKKDNEKVAQEKMEFEMQTEKWRDDTLSWVKQPGQEGTGNGRLAQIAAQNLTLNIKEDFEVESHIRDKVRCNKKQYCIHKKESEGMDTDEGEQNFDAEWKEEQLLDSDTDEPIVRIATEKIDRCEKGKRKSTQKIKNNSYDQGSKLMWPPAHGTDSGSKTSGSAYGGSSNLGLPLHIFVSLLCSTWLVESWNDFIFFKIDAIHFIFYLYYPSSHRHIIK